MLGSLFKLFIQVVQAIVSSGAAATCCHTTPPHPYRLHPHLQGLYHQRQRRGPEKGRCAGGATRAGSGCRCAVWHAGRQRRSLSLKAHGWARSAAMLDWATASPCPLVYLTTQPILFATNSCMTRCASPCTPPRPHSWPLLRPPAMGATSAQPCFLSALPSTGFNCLDCITPHFVPSL